MESEAGEGGNIWLVLSGLVLVSLVAYVVATWEEKPDRHYVLARDLVAKHETLISEDNRDYWSDVYETALRELGQVDPDSISAPAAASLETRIREGRLDQEEELEEQDDERETTRRSLQARRRETRHYEENVAPTLRDSDDVWAAERERQAAQRGER